ncbi:hypothetical protein DSM106972_092940 [Dulcicalothrix desertica PCC 7102]|uniref:Uncharacterized protein n=1 Tax=Dulcicalothrix desertica PCC 7102 TaxID=232991 RepID=A0A433ULD7_9CYAN|nr:hypothetical protein DSM106972_092940 [Dulcicalothrix desertica PCC 7102]
MYKSKHTKNNNDNLYYKGLSLCFLEELVIDVLLYLSILGKTLEFFYKICRIISINRCYVVM